MEEAERTNQNHVATTNLVTALVTADQAKKEIARAIWQYCKVPHVFNQLFDTATKNMYGSLSNQEVAEKISSAWKAFYGRKDKGGLTKFADLFVRPNVKCIKLLGSDFDDHIIKGALNRIAIEFFDADIAIGNKNSRGGKVPTINDLIEAAEAIERFRVSFANDLAGWRGRIKKALGNGWDVEEAIGDAETEFIEAITAGRITEINYTYFKKNVKRRLIDKRTRNSKHTSPLSLNDSGPDADNEPLIDQLPGPDDENAIVRRVVEKRRSEYIEEALTQLTPEVRATFDRRCKGSTLEEIAKEDGSTTSTSKRRWESAITEIAKHLAKNHPEYYISSPFIETRLWGLTDGEIVKLAQWLHDTSNHHASCFAEIERYYCSDCKNAVQTFIGKYTSYKTKTGMPPKEVKDLRQELGSCMYKLLLYREPAGTTLNVAEDLENQVLKNKTWLLTNTVGTNASQNNDGMA